MFAEPWGMRRAFDIPLGWGELLKRTIRETQADNGLGLAAQLAYYFFFALFPALLVLISIATFFPAGQLVDTAVNLLRGAAPEQVIGIISEQLRKIGDGRQGGLLTFGLAVALWSSSAAMVAIIDALNRAYDVQDARPWWKQRIIAILLTIGAALFVLVSSALVLAGPELASFVTGYVGLGLAFEWAWLIVQWPLVFLLVATAFGLIYYFAPHVDQPFAWLTPGSLLATTLWLLGSLAFRLYVVNFGSYNETYGTIGGVMVLLSWLYLSGLIIIIGAEMNSEIALASPRSTRARDATGLAAPSVREGAARARSDDVAVGDFRSAWSRGAAAVSRSMAIASGAIAAVFGGRRIRP